MQFTRLRVKNWRVFESEDVSFDPGITVIYGRNGAGKSSLLEAAYFALYGAAALSEGGDNLADPVTKGETETEVELWFTHGGEEFHIHRELSLSEPTATRASHDVTLETPDGEFHSVRAADNAIEEILRLDAESFVNCAFVRQNDITSLVEATGKERRNIIDGLLQLGQLETYQTRMRKVENGVGGARESIAGEQSRLEDQLSDFDDHLDRQQERVARLLDTAEETEAEWDAARESAETEQNNAEQAVEDLRERRDKRADLTDEVEEAIPDLCEQAHALRRARQRVQETKAERTRLRQQIETVLGPGSKSGPDSVGPSEVDIELEELEYGIEWLHLTSDRPGRENREMGANADESPDQIRVESLPVGSEADSEDLQKAVDEVAEQVEETHKETAELDRRRFRYEEYAQKATEQASDIRDELEELSEKLTQRQDDLEEAWEELEEVREKRTRHETTQRECREAFEESKFELEPSVSAVQSKQDSVESERDDVDAKRESVEREIDRLKEKISHAKNLKERGECPECGQSVEEAPRVTDLDEWEEQVAEKTDRLDEIQANLAELDSNLKTLDTLETKAREFEQASRQLDEVVEPALDRTGSKVYEIGDEIRELVTKKSELEQVRSRLQEQARAARERAEDLESDLREAYRRAVTADFRKQLLRRAIDLQDQFDDTEATLQERKERVSELEAVVDTLSTTIEEKREERDNIDPVTDDEIQQAEQRRDEAERRRERYEDWLEALDEWQTELTKLDAQLEERISRRETLKQELETVEQKLAAVESVSEQCERIRQLYGELRDDLREQNLDRLDTLLEEMFETVYQNDSYEAINLDNDYEATVHEKGGETLAVDDLSDGEAGIFNIALRAAIFRVLVEGFEDEAPMPPLILDEPTANLDDGHMKQLDDVVRAVREAGVDQTLVVSHDDELIDSADQRLEVRLLPGSNRSTVEAKGAGGILA